MADGLSRFFDSFSDKVGRDLPLFADGGNGEEPIIRHREPTRDELALGWSEGEDDETGRPLVQLVGVPQEHRATHMYVVGASGTGKTKFLETLAVQDATHGYGFGVIDAGSDLTEHLKGYLYLMRHADPDWLRENVVLIDPADPDYTVCFNPLERVDGMDTDMVVAELVEVFEKIWTEAWGNRMQNLLTNALTALVENDMTLAELPLFLQDVEFRRAVLRNTSRASCREYFENFNALSPHTQREWAESTLNKVGQLLSNNKVRQMFVSPESTFSFRDMMDSGKILLVKLDRGRLKGAADVLGSLLVAKIQMTAFARTDDIEEERVPFYLYVDEFQNFATESFLQTLAESRKYKLPLILAHQNLAQLPAALRASILGNCGLQAYFRISRADADILAKESLAPVFNNPPGWEWFIQQLQGLLPTWCVVKNNISQDVATLKTQNIDPPHVMANITAAELASLVAEARMGGAYLRSRAEVEEEYRTRRKKLLNISESESFRERRKNSAADYEAMIKGGENDEVEFKAGLRWLNEQKEKEMPMEYLIVKGVSAFMNTNGGTLFIGVQDDGKIIGIGKDYELIRDLNKRDGFSRQLAQAINKYLGKEFHQYASFRIVSLRDQDVCVISVSKSDLPVYLKRGDQEGFFTRASAMSQPMPIRAANEYIKTHFSKYRI